MLTDAALKSLKPKDKPYKVTDRDGMYVRVGTNGTISFRYDYRMHGRRETVTFGKYCASGLSLARAREVHRCQADGPRRTVPRHREAAGQAQNQRSKELRRVRREMADRWTDG